MLALQKEFGTKSVPAGAWLMRGLHDGAKVIRNEARRTAPVLKDATETITVTSKSGRQRSYQGTARRRKGALRAGIVEHTSRQEWGTVYVRVRSRGYIFGQNVTRGSRISSSLAGNPNYWWLVEFGTSHAPAQPFMRPAFESKKAEALRVIMGSLKRGLEAIVVKLRQIKVAA
jgi:HK97 gp10 family phage protein